VSGSLTAENPATGKVVRGGGVREGEDAVIVVVEMEAHPWGITQFNG
jgi:hypothetical protein